MIQNLSLIKVLLSNSLTFVLNIKFGVAQLKITLQKKQQTKKL